MAVDPAEKRRKLGQRWVCYACAAKFYDMQRPEPTCPRCGVDQRDDPALAPKPKAKRARSKKADVIPLETRAEEPEEAAARGSSEDEPGEDESFTEDDDMDELEIDDLELGDDEEPGDSLEDEVA